MTLKVLNWNIRYNNSQALTVLRNAIEQRKPDVICLQEVPETLFNQLATLKDYTANKCVDFQSLSSKDNSNIVTLTAKPVVHCETHLLNHEEKASIQSTLLYKLISKMQEHFETLEVQISHQGKIITILNAHLPCSVGPVKRLAQLDKLLSITKNRENPIACGDLNIMDPTIFNTITGIFRNFSPNEYFYNERQNAQQIISKHNFRNIFLGSNTSTLPFMPLMQFDHILLSPNFELKESSIEMQKGSDHFPIFVTVFLQ